MMSLLSSKSAGARVAAATLALCFLGPAVSAQATPGDKRAEAAATRIQKAVKAAGKDDAPVVKPQSGKSGFIRTQVRDNTVEIPKEATEARATVDGGSDGLKFSLGLPTAENADDAKVTADGTAIFADPSGALDVGVQTLADGGLRALTVINDKEAPTEFEYELGVDKDVVLESTPDGAVSIKGGDGSSQGFILPAWAVDAAGKPVQTHYEVAGSTVTQIVEHRAEGITYPVVADPKVYYEWWQLFTWSEWRWNSAYGMNQLSMELSAWGRHDVIFAADQFLSSGWNLLKSKHSSWIFTDSMRQQWECHVLGGIGEWGTFDLEYERWSNPNWRSRIGMQPISATCNW